MFITDLLVRCIVVRSVFKTGWSINRADVWAYNVLSLGNLPLHHAWFLQRAAIINLFTLNLKGRVEKSPIKGHLINYKIFLSNCLVFGCETKGEFGITSSVT